MSLLEQIRETLGEEALVEWDREHVHIPDRGHNPWGYHTAAFPPGPYLKCLDPTDTLKTYAVYMEGRALAVWYAPRKVWVVRRMANYDVEGGENESFMDFLRRVGDVLLQEVKYVEHSVSERLLKDVQANK